MRCQECTLRYSQRGVARQSTWKRQNAESHKSSFDVLISKITSTRPQICKPLRFSLSIYYIKTKQTSPEQVRCVTSVTISVCQCYVKKSFRKGAFKATYIHCLYVYQLHFTCFYLLKTHRVSSLRQLPFFHTRRLPKTILHIPNLTSFNKAHLDSAVSGVHPRTFVGGIFAIHRRRQSPLCEAGKATAHVALLVH